MHTKLLLLQLLLSAYLLLVAHLTFEHVPLPACMSLPVVLLPLKGVISAAAVYLKQA